ncbi:MAG: zinc-binding dehydrogenase [Planctomycetes bacterium]|nr:zinc-binding dehydrogenase [Planctomycetota bacterium]
MQTLGVRIYGKEDLRLEKFELPEPKDDEIIAEVISNSICMSSHKAAEQGEDHKRVPDDVAENPTLIGHEFSGRLLKIGDKWADRFEPGQKFGIQPALNYKGSLDAPGYSYQWIAGNTQKIIIPQEVMLMDCLLPYKGDAFFKASLSEPMSCLIGAFRAQWHYAEPGKYEHEFGIKEGGHCALLAAAGPMGQGAIDVALHADRQPAKLLVTDIDPDRLARAKQLFPEKEAASQGVELVFLNPAELPEGQDQLVDYVRDFTDGEMMDDVFVFFPHPGVIAQGDSLLARDGCLNFFAGPQEKDFSAPINFYDVHYERHHIVGTSGGNTEDMRIALHLMGENRVNPAGMITHVGGLNCVPQTILDLPDIPGGKKLIYTHVRMPLRAIDEFEDAAEEADEPLKSVFSELAKICEKKGGLWCTEAEDFLLSCEDIRLEDV